MEEVFKSFCAFGAGKDSTALMDNSKFAKLARDLKLLDKKPNYQNIKINKKFTFLTIYIIMRPVESLLRFPN